MPRRRRTGYRLKSGAVKVQVLFHPAEFRAIARDAHNRSVSAVVREIVAFHYAYPGGPIKQGGKYQRRGFANE